MVNFYMTMDVPTTKTLEVVPYMGTFTPHTNDVLFVDEEPVAKILTVEKLFGEQWRLELDRVPPNILIGNLVGIGTP